jgi:DNA-directed RNA polymerase
MKQKFVTLKSPIAIAAYAHLDQPDTKGKFADGKYKVTLKLKKGDADAEAFRAKVQGEIKKLADEQRKEWKKSKLGTSNPFKDGDTKDDDEGSKGTKGYWLFTAKTKTAPQLVDSKRAPLPKSVKIFGGDEIVAIVALGPYKDPYKECAGATIYLNGVQLIRKNNSGRDVSGMFDEVEDGFDAADAPAATEEGGESRAEDDADFA